MNELALTLENPNWGINTELAVIDTILSMHPEIYELVARDFSGKVSKCLGRGGTLRRSSKYCEGRSTKR